MDEPFFSIIIPTYNRPNELRKCLESLTTLRYPFKGFEVIIVNDGSEMHLDQVLAPFKDKLEVIMFTQSNSGPAIARNNGAKIAKGDFLAFTDDDCEPDRNWLMVLQNYLKKHPDCIIGGRTLNLLQNNIYSSASHLIYELAIEHYNAHKNHKNFFASNNMAISKQKFIKIGGFSRGLLTAEDRELCNRWIDKGFGIVFAPEAMVYHSHDLTLVNFARQHFAYGRGSYQFYSLKKSRDQGNLFNTLKFNLNPKNFLLHPFSYQRGLQGLSMAFLMLFWQVMNVSGFIFEYFNQKIRIHNIAQ